MENDDEKLTLRDKFAIEILSRLLDYPTLRKQFLSDEFKIEKANFPNTKKLILVSYKIADIMRKIRLGAFD